MKHSVESRASHFKWECPRYRTRKCCAPSRFLAPKWLQLCGPSCSNPERRLARFDVDQRRSRSVGLRNAWRSLESPGLHARVIRADGLCDTRRQARLDVLARWYRIEFPSKKTAVATGCPLSAFRVMCGIAIPLLESVQNEAEVSFEAPDTTSARRFHGVAIGCGYELLSGHGRLR